jgi:glyoxylase-like metal-dependent hydrolase (beta-lactamase superfamily II)
MATRKRTFAVIFFLAALTVAVFSFWGFLSCLRSNRAERNIDEFITATDLGPKVMVVRLGADAVIAIASQKGIVVVDAGLSNSLTTKYRKIIEGRFKRNDFVYLINTHSHPDHIGGNQVFAGSIMIGQENCVDEIAGYWKDRGRIRNRWLETVKGFKKELTALDPGSNDWTETFCKKVRYQYACDDLAKDRVVTAPSVTFKDSLSLLLGDMTLSMVYFGETHSKSDAVVHIPELRLLMTGDLFSLGGMPSLDQDIAGDGLERRKRAVGWIRSRWNEIETIVGGHGRVMTREDLKMFIEYLGNLNEL